MTSGAPTIACRRQVTSVSTAHVEESYESGSCPPGRFVAHTPWGSVLEATVDGSGRAQFVPDWPHVALDPLDPTTPELLQRPWRFVVQDSGRLRDWTPTAAEAQSMLEVLAEAKDTQLAVETGRPPPDLVVTDFHVKGDEFLGDIPAEVVLSIANRGSGPAYRVRATSRSSLASLHGLAISFGKIDSGATKTRSLHVTVPRGVEDPTAMVVLVFAEANNHAPKNFSRRFNIRTLVDSPKLVLRCGLPDQAGEPPRVDAGDGVRVHCEVRNVGAKTARGVTLALTVNGGAAPTRSQPQEIGPNAVVDVDVVVHVPDAAKLDSQLTFAIVATEHDSGRRVDAQLVALVGVPKVCPSGKLTRSQYVKKRAELMKALDEGSVTREEFDTYDAELVSCLE